jgi:hypothetical protein
MNTYLAKWPDGSVSLVDAETEVDLYRCLDTEGDPECAIIQKVDGPGYLHLTFNIAKQGDEQFIDADLSTECDDIKLKKFRFRKTASIKYLSEITGKSVKELNDNPELIKHLKETMGLQ